MVSHAASYQITWAGQCRRCVEWREGGYPCIPAHGPGRGSRFRDSKAGPYYQSVPSQDGVQGAQRYQLGNRATFREVVEHSQPDSGQDRDEFFSGHGFSISHFASREPHPQVIRQFVDLIHLAHDARTGAAGMARPFGTVSDSGSRGYHVPVAFFSNDERKPWF